MNRIAATAALSASLLALTATQAFADYTLNILHINDLHSRIESINKYDSTCSAGDETEGKCFGGIARVHAKIQERRSALQGEGANVIVLDAGDQFQGSLFYSTYKGKAAVEFMNGIGFDAMAVGNHEFDDGPDVLAGFIDAANFPVISGNTLVGANETGLAGKIREHLVLEIGGQKVGVLSVLATDTDETSSPGPNVLIGNEIAYLKDAVAELEGEGVNKIILLSHVGLPRDREIAAAVDGIDVIVGGHSHTLMSNTEEGAPPYPEMVANPSGKDVPIVQAYAYSKYVGELAVTFDDAGNMIEAKGDPILLDASVTPDPDVLARVQELAAPIEELKAKVVSSTEGPIEGSRDVCRAQECAMGNLVADAMLDRVRDQGIQVAIQNGGGLRASIDAGEVTMGEVLTVLPFQNTLATFQLKGADIIAALENGVSQVEEGAGRFPQVAGMRFTWDPAGEPGNRIRSVEVNEDGNWQAIDPDKTYGVVSNNFMRAGGDGYKVFATNGMNAYDYGPGLEEVVATYLSEKAPYQPINDAGRIMKAEAAAPAAEEKPAEAAAEEKPAETMAEKPADAELKVPERPGFTMQMPASGPKVDAPVVAPAAEEKPAEAAAEEKPAETMAEKPAEAELTVPERPGFTMQMPESGPKVDAPAADTEKAAMESAPEEKTDGAMAMADGVKMHVIVARDNFWDLARTYYGDPRMWQKIAEANPDANATGLVIGQELVIPAAE